MNPAAERTTNQIADSSPAACRNVVGGCVVWLTGISGAGKSTLADGLRQVLEKEGVACSILDGDVVRDFFENDLGYSRNERIQNVKRIAFAARLLADTGRVVLVANIAPYYEVRDFLRRKLPRYLQVYVDVSLEGARARDVKGLYSAHREGASSPLIGVDDPYEVPRRPDLIVRTEEETVAESIERIVSLLREKEVL